jgi:hypothetical protein
MKFFVLLENNKFEMVERGNQQAFLDEWFQKLEN